MNDPVTTAPLILDISALADYLGMSHEAVRASHRDATRRRARGQAHPSDLPKPATTVAGRELWLPATIDAWQREQVVRDKS